jgi:hypothetical protein
MSANLSLSYGLYVVFLSRGLRFDRSIGLWYDDDARKFISVLGRVTCVSDGHAFVVLFGILTTAMKRELSVFRNKEK